MKDSEQDELLYRLDERTEGMESDFQDIKSTLEKQDEQIGSNERRSRRNSTVLNAMTGGVATVLTALIGKFAGFIKF